VYTMPLQNQTMKNALIPLLSSSSSSSSNNNPKNNSGVTAFSNSCNTLCNNDSWHQKLDHQETRDNDGANTSRNKENSKPAAGAFGSSSSTFACAEQALSTAVVGSTDIIITKPSPTQQKKVTDIVVGTEEALLPIIVPSSKSKSKVLGDATTTIIVDLDDDELTRNKCNDTFFSDDDDRSCKTAALGLALAPFEPLSKAELVMVRHAFDMGLNDACQQRQVNHHHLISRRRQPQPTRSRHQTQQHQLGEDEDDENFVQMMELLDFSESCSDCRYGCDLCCRLPLL
jgi:hypothetical protein